MYPIQQKVIPVDILLLRNLLQLRIGLADGALVDVVEAGQLGGFVDEVEQAGLAQFGFEEGGGGGFELLGLGLHLYNRSRGIYKTDGIWV
jgi:hypothetical protein